MGGMPKEKKEKKKKKNGGRGEYTADAGYPQGAARRWYTF